MFLNNSLLVIRMNNKRPEFDEQKHGAMGLFNLFYRAQEQQYVENLSSSQGRWTVVGGFRRYFIYENREYRISASGLFVKREFESQPTMYAIKNDTLECLDSFLETMKSVNRFELFTGAQEIMDVRENSYIAYQALSDSERKLLHDILCKK